MVDVPWLQSALANVRQAQPGLLGWKLVLWEEGVRLALRLDGGLAVLDLRARVDGPQYATTTGLSVFLRAQRPSPLAPKVEAVVHAVVSAIDAADDGRRVLPQGSLVQGEDVEEHRPHPPGVVDPRSQRTAEGSWLEVARRLVDELPARSTWALRAHASGEGYPFVSSLGEPTDDPLEAAHAALVAGLDDGLDLAAFVERFGADPLALLPQSVGDLSALDAVALSGGYVRFPLGAPADRRIWATLAWSPSVQERAAAMWGVEPNAREALQRALGEATG